MLSIITAIYNQLPMNRLYLKSLRKYTKNKFELIIIDNGSTDGSCEFFEKNGAIVIRNKANYSYPHCQNQGIKAAKYDYLFFLNNDLIVSPHWDERVIMIMKSENIDIATCSATDCLESKEITYESQKRWKYIRNPLLFLFGSRYINLMFMHKLMYGNWEKWTNARYKKFQNQYREGISGSNVILTRNGLNKVGLWDERLQIADFDLFLRSKKRSIEVGDIKPVQLILGVYMHHFIRLTFKKKYPPFADKENLISLFDKWEKQKALEYIKDSDLVL